MTTTTMIDKKHYHKHYLNPRYDPIYKGVNDPRNDPKYDSIDWQDDDPKKNLSVEAMDEILEDQQEEKENQSDDTEQLDGRYKQQMEVITTTMNKIQTKK